MKHSELVYAEGFGVTKLGSNDLVSPETVFYVTSIAKSVEWMAVKQLV